ncbi:MAG: CocE/NonD family hydrolase [Cyanobacteria bacterium P01_A01_bin.84]
MHTRDGVRLDADIYRPDAKGDFPVLLMRQPYGREIASTVVYAHPSWYAAHGYIVVIQDVRGRGTSEGEFKLFVNEIEDGEDSVNWAAKLPGSNGNVGMYGFSYQGMTQLYAAAAKPAALKTICPAMIGYDLYSDWVYEGGAFCLQTNLAWAIQLATETAKLKGEEQAYEELFAASRNLPIYEGIPANPKVLKDFALDSFYHDWINYSRLDDGNLSDNPKEVARSDRPNNPSNQYWQKLSPKTYLQDVDLPMLHIGGWFDAYLRGTLHLYQDMTARNTQRQELVIGPWAHLPWGRKVGEVDFGFKAMSPVDKMQIRWFEQFLKGQDTGLLNEAAICLFQMGTNSWRTFKQYPSLEYQSYPLSTIGLASIREDSGNIIFDPESSIPDGYDFIVHDPSRPAPSLGGHAGLPSGSFERSHIDSRSDVLTYTSQTLDNVLHITGFVIVKVWCEADKPNFDLCAVLSQVQPDGKVYNITQGYIRAQQGNNPQKITLQATCTKILKGNALRLSLSASCFPAYAINPGHDVPSGTSRWQDAQIITIKIKCGTDSGSQILLPTTSASS